MSRCSILLPLALVLLAVPLAGAEPHWAYQVPVKRELPQVRLHDWPLNEIDFFVLAEMERRGISPAAPADPPTFIRRVTLDLTGLPPIADEIDGFACDTSPSSVESLVERLLASPRYGERMAQSWLDLARFADTHGYLIDSHREMWRWRDWVIDAFNENQPFDQFTVEQLAGDLLPSPTPRQVIATGFNRNHMLNYENGAIAEQYRVEYVADRVATTSTIWLGQTLDCARCHDHPYDPFTMREYYELFAFFNNVDEQGLDGKRGNAEPLIAVPTDEQQRQLDMIAAEIRTLEEWQTTRRIQASDKIIAWENQRRNQVKLAPPGDQILDLRFESLQGNTTTSEGTEKRVALSAKILGSPQLVTGKIGQALLLDGSTSISLPDEVYSREATAYSLACWIFPTAVDTGTIATVAAESDGMHSRWTLALEDGSVVVKRDSNGSRSIAKSRIRLRPRKWQHLVITLNPASESPVEIYVHGEPVEVATTGAEPGTGLPTDNNLGKLTFGGSEQSGLRGMIDEVICFGRCLTADEAKAIAASEPVDRLIAVPLNERSLEHQRAISDYYLAANDQQFAESVNERKVLERRASEIQSAAPTTMILRESSKPRDSFILKRGQFDQPAERVLPGIPHVLLTEGEKTQVRTRLEFANWLVSRSNPLTARVVVNRFWQHFFGEGLVRTPDDFGIRGELPTHPELLDWLAVELMDSGWDVKHLVRLIVTSQTYLQSSQYRNDVAQIDPDYRRLARMPRLRLDAEQIRDAALSASGMLDGRIGGPSVFPYQPPGLWEEVSFDPAEYTAQSYQTSRGADLYRRSLYTFWKRTLPPPFLQTFDAPTRERCTVSRSRTNTPLQALALMNEPMMVEASCKLAERMIIEGGDTTTSRAAFGFKTVVGRTPDDYELERLTGLYQRQFDRYRNDPELAEAKISVGDRRPDIKFDPTELAAWSLVASVVLGLDETITRN